jgi:hypothetical protein
MVLFFFVPVEKSIAKGHKSYINDQGMFNR